MSIFLIGALVAGITVAGANRADALQDPPARRTAAAPYVSGPFPAGTGSQPSGAATPAPVLEEGLGIGDANAAPTGPTQSDGALDEGAQQSASFDAVQQLTPPLTNFAGQNTGANPPDPVGDVGPNHYVQMVNSNIQVWDKQGNSLLNSIAINRIWQENTTAGTGFDQCRNQNAGDPIVLYDQQADRWMVSQFTSPTTATGPGGTFPMCIAFSRSGDPVGPNPAGATPTAGVWWVYQFNLPASHDYMKYGIWPDGLYMSTWEGGTLGAYVFDRAAMLSGSPATFQSFNGLAGGTGVDNRGNRILPSDWDGANQPPPGAPNYFTMMLDAAFDGGNDRLEIREFHVDWANPANTTFTLVTSLNTAAFDTDLGCANDANSQPRSCIPQPGTTTRVDALANRLMHRLQYRNFGDHQALVVSHTVDATTDNTDRAGVRWYELRNTGAGWSIFQQGTFAPIDGIHRWMPSAAMDGRGNIAIGYSVSDGNTTFPGLRYAARHATDPLGSMAQGEQTLINGATAETSSRWGDYSSMNVDPVDECTFWFTGENDNSQTTIGSFRLTSCNETDLAITKSDSPDPVVAGEQLNYTLTATNNGPNVANGVTVVDTLPAGVTFVSASAGCAHVAGVVTCNVGTLLAGQSVSLSIEVLVPSDFLGAASSATLTNVATISAPNQSDPNLSNNTATATTKVEALADLAVTKVCKPDTTIYAGTPITCTIFVDNVGPSYARGVVVDDVILSNGSFIVANVVPAIGPGTPGCTLAAVTGGQQLTCRLGDLANASTTSTGRATVTYTITADEGQDLNNVATTRSDTPDPNPNNNRVTHSLTVTSLADLALTKSGPATAVAGTNITYTLTVTNNGPSTAQNVVIKDALPADVRVRSVSASQGSCNAGVPGDAFLLTTCAIGTLAPAASATMTINVRIRPIALDEMSNDARASSDTFDGNIDNNLATVVTVVTAEADLSITKVDSPDPVIAGDQMTYTITVTNNGPSTAFAVRIKDTLPAKTSFVSGVDGTGATACALVKPAKVLCDLGSMSPATTKTVLLTVLVKASVDPGAVLSNTVKVVSATPDPDPTDNEVTETTTVETSAEVWLDKQATQRSGNPSPILTYTLVVHNNAGCETDAQSNPTPTCGSGGPSDARDIVVTDQLPLNPTKLKVQYVSPKCTYTKATHSVVCSSANVPAGASVTFVIEMQVQGSVGLVTNTASVTSSTFDPVVANNTNTATIIMEGSTG